MQKRICKTFFWLALIFVAPNFASATPGVSLVSGDVSDGNQIIINGSAFGNSGPDIKLFDSFQGTSGLEIPLDSAVIGS